MKNLLKNKDISSVPKLKAAIKELWTQELTIGCLQKLSDSAPRRPQMVEVAIKSRNDCPHTFCCGAEALFCENFIRIPSIFYIFIMQILLLLFQCVPNIYVLNMFILPFC
jgi:hypothetical protein